MALAHKEVIVIDDILIFLFLDLAGMTEERLTTEWLSFAACCIGNGINEFIDKSQNYSIVPFPGQNPVQPFCM